jgi:hypothetical protein
MLSNVARIHYQFGIVSLLHRENTAVNERRVEENRGAFADGEYEIACNLLLVALRCGQRLKNVEYLRDIERLAEYESRFLDDHHPESQYSNKAAQARGDVGAFQMAAQRARKLIRYIRGLQQR